MSSQTVSREHLLREQNEELLPSKPEARSLSIGDLVVLCAGMVVNVVGLVIPSQVFLRGGVSPFEILLAAFLGFALVTFLIVLSGDIGTRYGVPFTVIIRDCFGKKGAIVGSFGRAVVCMTWCGVILFFGTSAINSILKTWMGVSAFWVVFVVFAALQLWNASRNVKSMSRFGWLAIPFLAVALAGMVVWLLQVNNITLHEALTRNPVEGAGHSMITIIAIFSGGWLSEALNGSDLSRKLIQPDNAADLSFFARNKGMIIGFALGFIGTGIVLSGAGLIAGVLTGQPDPVAMINTAFEQQPVVLAASCIIIVMAQWSTNTCANIFPATLIFLNAFPRLTFAKATWLVGLISCAMMPWLLANSLDIVQMVFSALLGPLLAIMLTHYYLVRRCVLDVASLYDGSLPDWNKAGLIALAAGLAAGAVFYEYAFFAAFPIAGMTYFFLAGKAAPVQSGAPTTSAEGQPE